MKVRCRLREYRGDTSLRDIAQRAGVSSGVLSMIEQGRTLPNDKQLKELERVYERPVTDWYDWRGPLLPVEMDDSQAAA